MIFLGDYFALGLLAVLFLFYFEGGRLNRYMSVASKWFVVSLVLSALSAAVDLITGQLLAIRAPLWANFAANTVYFVLSIVTTSAFALYLFTRILEHAHDDHCMTYAKRGLFILFSVYMVLVAANFKTFTPTPNWGFANTAPHGGSWTFSPHGDMKSPSGVRSWTPTCCTGSPPPRSWNKSAFGRWGRGFPKP